jgi:hypothetical protein
VRSIDPMAFTTSLIAGGPGRLRARGPVIGRGGQLVADLLGADQGDLDGLQPAADALVGAGVVAQQVDVGADGAEHVVEVVHDARHLVGEDPVRRAPRVAAPVVAHVRPTSPLGSPVARVLVVRHRGANPFPGPDDGGRPTPSRQRITSRPRR